jgi:aspartate aminotransferase
MKQIMTHIGAWAPMAEQKALAVYLQERTAIENYLTGYKKEIEERLNSIYNGLMQLKQLGLPVDAIKPEAAIYLTVKIDAVGKTTPQRKMLSSQADVTAFLLDAAGLALVPFYAFGASASSPWYRMSIGTCKKEEIPIMLQQLQEALQPLR